jgi:UDP-N-acetylglucosamine--N-acetylmuramyl-(pentapeptide) pyrophosphoryl-undecaprenol N-acetylglucosamine transferase
MRIALVGGGSGGHITPLLAVARELKALNPNCLLIYIGERGGKFSNIAKSSGLFDELHYVSAGKIRRYHGESLFIRLTDLKTIFLNIRDLFRLAVGTLQSVMLLRSVKADAALLKGGYVCVPVSLGAKLAGVPTITHDSDALPGLSNRFAARFATYHATAMPAKYYKYPKETVKSVGLPVDATFRAYTKDEQRFIREKYGIQQDATVVLITGGSNGARRLNQWCIEILPELLDKYVKLHIIHIYGEGNEDQFNMLNHAYLRRITRMDFTSELFHCSAIADIIITRAGATTLAEFAAQSKACIVVPNPDLTGGHQLKNVVVYQDTDSIITVHERDLKKSVQILCKQIISLIEDPGRRKELGKNLNQTLPKEPAAKEIAKLLLEIAQ